MTLYYNKDEERAQPPEPTSLTKVRRRSGRGRYEREVIEEILDEGLIGHVAIVSDGQPYAIPMLYARRGDQVYLHGSPLSRLVGAIAQSVPMCLTVTLVDGLVFARSAFHHSVNYRSVVVLGHGRAVRDPAEKLAALRTIVEHVSPGRFADARGPNAQELKATEVVALGLQEASAKLRTGPPIDAPEDYASSIWAGELPLRLVTGDPVTDSRCAEPVPEYVRTYRRGRG